MTKECYEWSMGVFFQPANEVNCEMPENRSKKGIMTMNYYFNKILVTSFDEAI